MKRPVPDPSWSDEVRAVHRHDLQEWWEPALSPHIWRQYHNQLDRYLQFVRDRGPLRILDVGCAQGTLALLLAEMGHEVVAVDLRDEFLAYAKCRYEKGRIEFIAANAVTLDLGRSFDLIFANQIVEHLVYPEQLLSTLATHLVQGGRLVMSTPNWSYIRISLPKFSELGDRGKVEHLQFTADGDGHFFAYTADELSELVRDAGFTNVTATPFESPAASGHMKARYFTRWLPLSLVERLDRWICSVPWIGARVSHQLLVTGTKGDVRAGVPPHEVARRANDA